MRHKYFLYARQFFTAFLVAVKEIDSGIFHLVLVRSSLNVLVTVFRSTFGSSDCRVDVSGFCLDHSNTRLSKHLIRGDNVAAVFMPETR